jgi:flagellar basal-body rod protein FlgG
MDPALRAAATGMMAQQTRTEVIANNLANVNTTAFKRSTAHFEDLLYQTVQGATVVGNSDAKTLAPVQIGRGVHLASISKVHEQGAFEDTQRPFDIAIEGEGFFQITMPNGSTAYSRDGSFQVSDQGTLVTQGGYTVVPGIKIPNNATNFGVSKTGVVTVQLPGSPDATELGRIELARFANPAGLIAAGENLYTPSPASGEAVLGFPQDDSMGKTVQGALESSNVEIVQEMVDMITAMRAYELNSKAIKNSEEMADIANNMIR